MARVHVEPWAPEYGGPLDVEDEQAFSPDRVDDEVEVSGTWRPIGPTYEGSLPTVAFIDGVRRPDARLALDDGDGMPIPGVCGSYAVGAVLWGGDGARADVASVTVRRVAVFGDGRAVRLPAVGPGLVYQSLSTPDRNVRSLIQAFHGEMRRTEAEVAEDFARGGYFVVADGPLNILSALPKVGYIKSHRVSYLPPRRRHEVAELAPRERTPVFGIPDYERYSWYLRLGAVAGGHSWSGVVRCEVAHALGKEGAIRTADLTIRLLPEVASERHRDPRAPQNLVPIAGLEQTLRRRLGVGPYLQRQIIEAVATEAVPV